MIILLKILRKMYRTVSMIPMTKFTLLVEGWTSYSRYANEDVNLNNINKAMREEAVKNEKRNSHVSRDSTRIVNCPRASQRIFVRERNIIADEFARERVIYFTFCRHYNAFYVLILCVKNVSRSRFFS